MAVKRTTLYIDEELLKKLKVLAIHEGKKVNDLIIESIENELSKRIPDEMK
ncbi:MAG: hypothetical protein AB2417_20125 [Clostridiaceae bacterium]